MKDGNALELVGVSKRYGRRWALARLDLTVPRGAVFGLVGSNGAGKTTCLTVAAGIIRPTGGKVDVLGNGAFSPQTHAGRVSLLPQDTDLPPVSRVGELLLYYAELQGIARAAAHQMVNEVLDWVHLSDRRDSAVRTLSHGMKRRVMIAQAFLGNPELILLDEPLSGLDPKEVVNIRNILCERRGHQTIVISSHNLHEIERICDHLAFIEKGRRIRQDSMANVTGKRQVVIIQVGPGTVPVDPLRQALPGVTVEVAVARPGEEGGHRIAFRYGGGELEAPDVNARALPVLLEHGLGVVEINRGDELESAYLAGIAARFFPLPRRACLRIGVCVFRTG